MKEGVLIVPSHMGERPIRAMHGYHPSTNTVTPRSSPISGDSGNDTAIPQIYDLMTMEAVSAVEKNKAVSTPDGAREVLSRTNEG